MIRSLLTAGFLLISCLFAFAQSNGEGDGNDCRMTVNEIVPVISRFNPFFTDHSWDNQEKLEIARLDPDRLLTIRQKACLRHHILFTLNVEPRAIDKSDERFWISEVLIMMKRVYFDNSEYLSYKKDFELEFIRRFLATGTNQMFNFPVGERTFICKVEEGSWGARIKIEVVRFLLKENIKRPGIPREQDDGFFKGES